MRVISDYFLRGAIDFLPDTELRRTAPAVIRTVLATLIFGEFDERGVPAVGSQARGLVDWQAKIVADFGAGEPLTLVFVKSRGPLSGRILLSQHRTHESGRQRKNHH